MKARNPILAGFLGLIPGFGQLYNDETVKGFILLGTGIINLAMLGFVAWLLSDPLTVLTLMQQYAGLSLALKPAQLIADLIASPILAILVSLNILFSVFSSWEAYRTARSQKFDYLEAPEKRPQFVQTFCTSYLGHILTLVLLILVPIIASGGANGQKGEQATRPGGRSFSFDIVTAPGTVDGFGKKPEGTDKGKGKNKPQKNLTRIARSGGRGAKKVKPAAQAKGTARSYNEYLSYRFHSSTLSGQYFEQLPVGEYTVLQYTVDADGTVENIEILRDHSTTSEEVSQLAVETVRSFNPAAPLPPGIGSLRVVELFWSGSTVGDPGSLENELSQKIDGRKVYVEP